MSYDEIEIEDMTWNEELQAFTYPCPCGDKFQITLEELRRGEDIAGCPGCSLYITVVYDPVGFHTGATTLLQLYILLFEPSMKFQKFVPDSVMSQSKVHYNYKFVVLFGIKKN
ncbi:hypothetical protein CEUSTIGMA_g3991.t1 [Chlamydomonas eustigma]|uniref:Diphthamide biosynthesis protein 3 n=1 Tax=Chlamydomonas eustigma TaxID=1157962 RepID=A0A250X0H4_9CHLO|nr:hypothetical protein CEUSTIGMA_g3991.t1 [Chlamydomonas eustigma]|eukprot:GAX76545.1 hypothetical protein CEUSTIGMA_g3991.t1 [Chlamydomonas eustigma]